MRFKGLAAAVIASALAATGYALADVNYTQGTGTVIYDFVCFVSKHCSAHVPINSAGTEIFTSTTPAQVSLANTGANATAIKVDGSAVTQPVSGTVSVNTHAVTQSGTWTVQPGNTANTTPWLVQNSSDYPSGATALTASATGTTLVTTATLAAAVGKTTYICSLSIRSNATAAATGNATVTGTVTGTLNYTHWTAPLASGVGVTEQIFTPCMPASATNTSIAVVSPAPGSGGTVSVTATGYQL